MFFSSDKKNGQIIFPCHKSEVRLNKKHGASDKMCAGRDAK